jgi:hypothetical protein
LKTNAHCPGPRLILLAAVLFPLLVPAARGQNLTLLQPALYRRVLIPFYAYDNRPSSSQSYQDQFTAITNIAGEINFSGIESTPVSFQDVSAACAATQDATVTATATSLSVTGQVEIASSGSAFSSQDTGGAASWTGLSEIIVGFSIDRSFTYSLSVATTMNTNATETFPTAYAGLDTSGDSAVSLPNVVAYGALTVPGPQLLTAPSAGGTNTGVLAPGNYYFIARVHTASGVDSTSSPMSEHFLVAFNLSITYPPPQPPVITAFTPDSAGGFNLIWNAPQAGNYRVLSSTDLVAWSELIPAAAAPSGLNTNVVSATAGPGAAFFRIQYLP